MSTLSSSFKVESGIQLLARLSRKPSIENFYPELFQSGPKPGDVIEMFSEEHLTSLLVDITCTALLPSCLKGSEAGVLIINCSGHLNFNTLTSCMENKIRINYKTFSDKSTVGYKEDMDDLLEKALCNLFFMEVYDATQFYATIYNLENVLMEHPSISMVIFDTVTAFYWSEQSFKIMKMDTYLKKILQKIQKVTREFKVTILYTRPEYFCSNKDTESLEPCCEKPTSERVNYRIQIAYTSNSIYHANISSYKMQVTKQFKKIEEQIKWIS